MSLKCLPRWKLPNGNFYPISMACTANDDKQTTTVMVASDELVVYLSVKNINRTFYEDLSFAQYDLESDEPIRALKATDTNVFLVLFNGQLMVKDLTDNKFVNIAAYNRVLHVEWSLQKSQLFLVRQMETGQIKLEIVDNSTGFSPHITATKRYDLVMEGIDTNTRFSIKSIVANEANEQFLSDFLGFTQLSVGDLILLIAFNNSLYWLLEQDSGESDLIAVRCFASYVIGFEFYENCLCLTVLLQSGVLVVFKRSSAPEALTVATSSVFLTVPIEAFAFEKENNVFLYSNGSNTHRVHFYYSEETKQIVTETKEFPVSGVIAISLLESKSMALLLTDNNQFYCIDCGGRKPTCIADVPKMFVLGADKRTVSKRMTKRLTEEVYLDKRLDDAMQTEQAKFDVLALHNNQTVFERLSFVNITFTREMPPRKGKILYIGNQNANESVCLFVSMSIEINQGFFTLLANQRKWSICIERNESFVTYPVHKTFDSDGMLNGMFFLNKRELANGLPTFRFKLVTTIKHGNEYLLLTIPMPVSVQSMDECAVYLVQNASSSSSIISSQPCVKVAASSIITQYNPQPDRLQEEERRITYCIRNEQSKTKAISFSNRLENNNYDMWSSLDALVTISWHGARSAVCLTTNCPVAMDVVKRFLLDKDEYDAEINQRRDKLKGMFLELQAITDDDLIIKLYRKVRNHDIIDDDLPQVPCWFGGILPIP